MKYQFKFYGDPPAFAVFGDGIKALRYGIKGGRSGKTNLPVLNHETPEEKPLKSKAIYQLKEEDVYTIFSSGGGGWGNPLERAPESVAEDIRNEIVSNKEARETYGVVVDKDCNVDLAATSRLRTGLKE